MGIISKRSSLSSNGSGIIGEKEFEMDKQEFSAYKLNKADKALRKFTKLDKRADFVIKFYSDEEMPVILALTNKEWINLLEFLKKTKSKKFLPQSAICYSNFDIHTNNYGYYEAGHSKRASSLLEKIFVKDKEIKKLHYNFDKGCKSTLLTSCVTLRKNNIFFSMCRRKFQRFREFILKHNDPPVPK